jgi:hypothetical protein
MKKLIDKCDLYFEGHIISKELLLQNYADFLAGNFEKKHNVAISLHTGSICFDIITIVFTAISNIVYNQDNAEDFVTSLNVGDMVLYKKTRCRFEGLTTLPGETIRRAILYSETVTRGLVLENREFVKEEWWNKISPYNGKSTKFDARGIRTDNKKRNDFLSSVLEMAAEEIPAYIVKSSVIVMNRERSERVIDNLEIEYDGKRIKITEIIPVSYCSENEEYPYGGNPGKIEPAIKITNNISNARSLVTGSWEGNETWEHDVIGVSVIGFGAISRARSEVTEIMKRRKLKYVFVSYNIASEDGETLLDEVEDASVFACTTEYLLNCSVPTEEENPYTLELDKQVDSVINHETIPLPVKTFDCDWNTYRKVQVALSRLRHSSARLAEDYVPLAHSMINLMITSVFPLELMEDLVVKGILEVESPIQRIERLTEMTAEFIGEDHEIAKTVLEFLEDGYLTLLSTSPKEQQLFSLLEENRGKKIALIVPKAYYANILYNQNILDYFDDASQLCISTANKFDYSQQYDIIVAIGAFWGKKFDPFRCRSASTIYVMVSAVEENLFKYRRKLASAIEYKFNVSAKVPMDAVDIQEETYNDGATEEEVAEVIGSTVDVTAYINQILVTRSLEIPNIGGNHTGMAEISHIATCADGERIFFTKKYRAFVFDSAKEDVIETSVDKLSPGDTVIFKSHSSETKDIVTTLLDKYLAEYNTADIELQMAYWRSQYWKAVLKEYREENHLSFKALSKRLEKFGSKKHEVTIQSWLAEDSYIVGPQENETFIAIAEMTQEPDLLADPKSFCDACDTIRRVRVRFLKLIAKTIISKYSGRLAEDSDMARVVSENIDEISILAQIETITPVAEKKAPINMINRPITVN